METTYLLILFGTSCITTWVFLLLFYIIYTNKKRLINNRYSDEYISFLRKDYRKRSLGIAIALPILLLSAYSIYWLFFGIPNSFDNLIYIFLIFLILVLPFPVMDIRKSKKEYKKLALETNAEIIIDLKFKVLHSFFSPFLEMIFLALFVSYYLISPNTIPVIVFIHLLIPWLIYLSARNSKFLTKPLMKDGYLFLFVVITVNYLIVIFYIYRYGIKCLECSGNVNKTFSMVVLIVLLLKILYSLFNFIQTRRFYTEGSS
jgi:hypothetical protein